MAGNSKLNFVMLQFKGVIVDFRSFPTFFFLARNENEVNGGNVLRTFGHPVIFIWIPFNFRNL